MIGSVWKSERGRTFARFLAMGLINTLFGYSVYAVLIVSGMEPQPALILAFAIGVIWNFFTTTRFVFRVTGLRRLPIYAGCYVVVYLLNAGCLEAMLRFGLSPLMAQAILTPVFAVVSFLLISFALTGRLGGSGG